MRPVDRERRRVADERNGSACHRLNGKSRGKAGLGDTRLHTAPHGDLCARGHCAPGEDARAADTTTASRRTAAISAAGISRTAAAATRRVE